MSDIIDPKERFFNIFGPDDPKEHKAWLEKKIRTAEHESKDPQNLFSMEEVLKEFGIDKDDEY